MSGTNILSAVAVAVALIGALRGAQRGFADLLSLATTSAGTSVVGATTVTFTSFDLTDNANLITMQTLQGNLTTLITTSTTLLSGMFSSLNTTASKIA